MYKNLKIKKSREFLKNYFPENILPFKNLVEKDKRYIRDKLQILKRAKRRIKKVTNKIQFKQKQNQSLNKIYYKNWFKQKNWFGDFTSEASEAAPTQTYTKTESKNSFLYSSTQIKNDFLRNQNWNRPISDFLLKIKEKKKFSLLYGNISKKYYQKVYIQALKSQKPINDNLITLFETRLDTILYRICFAKNISAARQIINHNLITVNGIYINIPSYQVKPGDYISVDKKKKKNLTIQIKKNLKQNFNKKRFHFLVSTKVLKQIILYYLILEDSKFFLPSLLHLFQKRNNIKTIKKFIQKFIKFSQKQYKKYGFPRGNSQVWKNKPIFSKRKKFKKILNKQYKNKNRTRYLVNNVYYQKSKQISNKRKIFLPLVRYLQKINIRLNHLNISSKKNLKFLHKIHKKRKNNILCLKLKKFFYRKQSRLQLLWSMRFNPIKPLHVEVSYKIMCAILLYAPQKIVYPGILNIDLLSRSLAKK